MRPWKRASLSTANRRLQQLRRAAKQPVGPAAARFRRLLFEPFEARRLLADLNLTSVQLTQGISPYSPTTPVLGEQVCVRANYQTTGLPADANYRIEFQVDGVPLSASNLTSGAGFSSGNWFWVRCGWFASPGSHTAQVILDADNTVAETSDTNNSLATPLSFSPVAPTTLPQKFLNPLGGVPYHDWAFVNYYDVDTSAGIKDYQGGPFSYDGHNGHDITLPNFARMDAGIPEYAAADGTVQAVADGNFDRNTDSPNVPVNFIRIDHGNGWKTEYLHMANGTITVNVGDQVKAGQFLGLAGSSGHSTDAHLHFAVTHNGVLVETEYDPTDYYVSPYAYQGSLPTTILDAGITNFAPTSAEYKERPAEQAVFSTAMPQNVQFWFRISYLNAGDSYQVKWYRPDGVLSTTFNYTSASIDRYGAHRWSLSSSVADAFLGTWRVAVQKGGVELVSRSFNVTSGAGAASIKVTQLGAPISDNRTTAVDFGSVGQGGTASSQTFVINNHGTAPLTLSGLLLPPGFALNGSFPTTVAAGASANLTIDLTTTTVGSKFGSLQFTTNDPDTPTFNFNISGTVSGSPPAGAPVLSLAGPALAYTKLGQSMSVKPGATVTDSDSPNFGGGTLTAEFTFVSSIADTLGIQNGGSGSDQIGVSGTTVTYAGSAIGALAGGSNGIPLVISLNSSATLAAIQALLRSITFSTTATHPQNLARYVRFSLVDEAAKVSNRAIAVVDQNIRPTEVSLDASGNLTITDSSAAGKDDNWKVERSGANLKLSDLNGSTIDVSSIAGATGNGSTVVLIPLSVLSPTGQLVVDGREGNDLLTIDLTNGNPIPAGGVFFNGGNPTTAPGDKLNILGGDQGTVTYTYTNGHDGKIVMSNFGTVNYTGLEPISNTGTATSVVFKLPLTASTAILEDDGTTGNGMSQLRSTNGTFETTTFVSPSGTVTINDGNAADALTVNSLPDLTASITIGSGVFPLGSVSLNGTVTLASGKSLAVDAGAQTVNATGNIITSGGGTIRLTADTLDINAAATLNAGSGIVTIAPESSGKAVTLGAETAGTLSLTEAELDRIIAGTLRLGDKVFGGPITIAAPINVANNTTPIPTLHLLSSGAVVNNSVTSPAVTATNLAVEGFAGNGSLTTLTTQTTNLTAAYNGYDLRLTNTGDLTITDVDGVTGGTGSTGGGTTLSTTGSLTINAFTASTAGPTIVTASGQDKLLTINDTVGGLGDVTLSADKMAINSFVSVPAYNVTLRPATAGAAINLGSLTDAAANTLELSNAEIGWVRATKLQIGNATSGAITAASSITPSAGMNISLTSGVAVNFAAGTLTTGGGTISLVTDAVDISAGAALNAGSGVFSLLPNTQYLPIDVGSPSFPMRLGITDQQLDRITAGSIRIGDNNSGYMNVSADVTRSAQTNINLASGAVLNLATGLVNTAGGNLSLSPQSVASVSASKAGTDADLGTNGTLSFASGSKLQFAINGKTVDTQYEQLNVVGKVDLTNVNLALSGSYAPVIGDRFTLVANDGTDAITSYFNGLPESQIFTIASGKQAGTYQVTYQGGDGNDVVITRVSTTSPDLNGTSGDDVWLVKRNAANVEITLNSVLVLATPFSGLSYIRLHGADGNDTLNIDLSAGDAIPTNGLEFDGDNPTTTPGDKLNILGGSQGQVTYTYTNGHDGNVSMTNFGTVYYFGLEQINNTGSATDITFKLPATGNVAVLEDDGTTGNNISVLRSPSSSFETTTFTNPSSGVALVAGTATDALTVNSLPDLNARLTIGNYASPFGSMTMNGAVALAPLKPLTVYAAAQTVTATGNFTNSNPIVLITDTLDIDSAGTLSAGLAAVTIAQLSANRPVTLGAKVAGTLSLTDAELDRIVTSSLTIGDASFQGSITISNPINVANNVSPIPSLRLLSGGAIVNNCSTSPAITATKLIVEGVGGPGTTTTLTAQSSNLGASYDFSGNLNLANTGDLTLFPFDGLTGAKVTHGGDLTLTTAGSLTINGYTGSDSGFTKITAGGQDKLLTINFAVSGHGDAALAADKMAINTTLDFTGHLLTLAPATPATQINLGSATDMSSSTLELSNSEVGAITTKTLQIGDATSGAITISSDITPAAGANVNLTSGGAINFTAGAINTGGGNLTLSPGSTATIGVTKSGTDVNLGTTGTIGTLSFASGADLAIAINGSTVDTQYQQLNVLGQINLTGVDLVLSGNSAPVVGTAYTIVNNDGADPIMGTFNGLAEGQVITVSQDPFSGTLQITYHGGDGNDIVLTPISLQPTLDKIDDPIFFNEDVTSQLIQLTGIGAGYGHSLVSITATSDSQWLIPNPSIDYTSPATTAGLSFQPIVDQFGTATITVTVKDDGPDDSNSFSRTFSITIDPVNDPPSFSHLSGNYSAKDENPLTHGPALAESFPGWATNLSAGPANESTQKLSFSVTTDNNSLFAVQPAVSTDGTLTYTPRPNAHGIANVFVLLQDDGGGANSSQQSSFQIEIVKTHRLHNAAEVGPRNGRDVTGSTSAQPDGFIVAADALAVINYINAKGSGQVLAVAQPGPPYPDVDGDDQVVAQDVLDIINYINSHPGQSEAPLASTAAPLVAAMSQNVDQSVAVTEISADLINLLAADSAASQLKRRRSTN
jgi:murein DD-endopeptidase MepM/ murein hydrolase activator NlpD